MCFKGERIQRVPGEVILGLLEQVSRETHGSAHSGQAVARGDGEGHSAHLQCGWCAILTSCWVREPPRASPLPQVPRSDSADVSRETITRAS